jgi:hypothetical protein
VIEECPSHSCTTFAGRPKPSSTSRLIHDLARAKARRLGTGEAKDTGRGDSRGGEAVWGFSLAPAARAKSSIEIACRGQFGLSSDWRPGLISDRLPKLLTL